MECLTLELADCRKEAEENRTASTLLEQQLRGGSTHHDVSPWVKGLTTELAHWSQSLLHCIVCAESRQCVGEVRETAREVQTQHRKQEVKWKQEKARLTHEVARLSQEVTDQKEAVKVCEYCLCCLWQTWSC